VSESRDRLQIGEFAELVGLSIPQLRRYDRLRLLEPAGRTGAGYRFYTQCQTGATRVIATDMSTWLHLMPRLPVGDMERSIAYYQEALGLNLTWRTVDGSLAALATGEIEVLLLVPWTGEGAPPAQSSYVYVEDPDALCAEFQEAGADIVDPVASRPYGMRDFVVRDPDGHRFTLGRGEEALRDVADYYGLDRHEISVGPPWLQHRQG
jgi:catechol 2,3-dioxygenase-like lactoylglutathione lyase family enzyme